MSAVIPNATSPEVSPDAKIVTLLACEWCGAAFVPVNKRQRFCGVRCRVASHRDPHNRLAAIKKEAVFKARNRDKSLGFDGRYGGPVVSGSPVEIRFVAVGN